MSLNDLALSSESIKESPKFCNTTQLHKARRKGSFSSMFSDPFCYPKHEKSGGLRKLAKAFWNDTSYEDDRIKEMSRGRTSSRGRAVSRESDRNSDISDCNSYHVKDSQKRDLDQQELEAQKLRSLLLEDSYLISEAAFDAKNSVANASTAVNKITDRPEKHLKPRASHAKSKSIENYRNVLERSKPDDLVKRQNKILQESLSRRAIVIRNIPPNTSAGSILAQVCCGALEKLIFRPHKEHPSLELYFIFPDQAKRFYDFATKTGLFKINGAYIDTQWANKTNTEDMSVSHPPVPKYLIKEIVHGSARRVLVFSKVIPEKAMQNSTTMHYPSPQTHLTKDFDISLIKKDFSQYGEIIEFGAVISRKLCFSIHFADVRSAIIAKREVESEGLLMNSKYFGWSLWYGKDPTDKPCYAV